MWWKDDLAAKNCTGRKKTGFQLSLTSRKWHDFEISSNADLISTTSSSFLAIADLIPFNSVQLTKAFTQICVKTRNIRSYGMATYGLVFVEGFRRHEARNEFGKIGMAVLNKYDAMTKSKKYTSLLCLYSINGKTRFRMQKSQIIEGYKKRPRKLGI